MDHTACKALQNEEWEVLQSIYPDCLSSDISDGVFKLEIPIDLGESRQVTIVDDGTVAALHEASVHRNTLLSLSTLPPLLLTVVLLPTYPLESPPQIVSLHATHSWLPQPEALRKLLQSMWQPGEGVLYDWVESIRSAEFLETMGLISSPGTVSISHPAPHLLAPLLLAHERATKSTEFLNNSYTCAVCLTSYKGARCLQLACSHVFCRSCLEDFWKLCIAEGDVGRVGCPDPECVKAGREAVEEEVLRVVTDEEAKRWRWLREKRAVEKDPSIIHCPMAFCQTPVPKPVTDDEDSGWVRLRTCHACHYSFCSFCKRTWHGPLSDCPISVTETLVLEYLALPEDSPSRRVLERRFGRANIARLVAKYEEDQANKKYLEDSTMACPGCKVHVQKSLGCNHMTCAKCHMHFCYRCGEKLNGGNPYIHFSTPGQRCYYKLFDFQSVDEEWQAVVVE